MVGKNAKFTTEQIIQALKDTNGLISLAARNLGCGRQTVYNRMRTSKAIRRAVRDSRGELLDYAEKGLRAAVENKELGAIIFTLKTIGKGRGYVERNEITSKGGKALAGITLVWRTTETDKSNAD